MQYKYDKDELKNNLDIESVASLVSHLGGEPILKGEHFVAKTICHNDFGEGSHKLYYYENTKLFKCYTNCDTMDIFELVIHTKKMQEGVEWQLPQAMQYVASFFGISPTEIEDGERIADWKVLNNYDRIDKIDLEAKEIQLKTYNRDILKYYPQPRILPWEQDGILPIVMKNREIAYNPVSGGIIIPHFDINGNLVGIRERTLVQENEKYGKYRPSIINKVQYNHPLSFNLYGLDKSKDNIKAMKTAIIVEGEKSVLQYESYFGISNSLVAATCGSNLINFQVALLLSLGVKEIVVGFDKDFIDKNDPNFIKVVKRLKNIDKKYGSYAQISFLFDKEDLLGYKDSPLDQGPEVFQHMYTNRITL